MTRPKLTMPGQGSQPFPVSYTEDYRHHFRPVGEVMTFTEFYKIMPKYGSRNKRMESRLLFEAITGPGLPIKIGGIDTVLRATPEDLITGAKAHAMMLDDMQFAPGVQVWLRAGRWEDHDNAEELAARYDRQQATVAELGAAGKLRVVG